MRLIWLVALLALPLPAAAHAILVESQPAARATLPPGPLHIVLRFNSRIDAGRSRIELRGGPAPVIVKTTAGPTPDTLVADATANPGAWTLRWQVLAIDGHITRGDVPLTISNGCPKPVMTR